MNPDDIKPSRVKRTVDLSARQVEGLRLLDERLCTLTRYLQEDAIEALKGGSYTRARNLIGEIERTVEVWMIAGELESIILDGCEPA